LGAVVKMLLNAGKVNINVKDKYGWTPLIHATWRGNGRVVKMLLDIGKVDVDYVVDIDGQTAFLIAVAGGHKGAVKMLMDTGKIGVDVVDNDGQTPLLHAAQRGLNMAGGHHYCMPPGEGMRG
jgi:ankyrin repeat protein